MIWAAMLVIGGVLGLLGIIAHAIWYTRKPPRNRYVRRPRGDVLPKPSEHCRRVPDFRREVSP